jgi:hypothetical protein
MGDPASSYATTSIALSIVSSLLQSRDTCGGPVCLGEPKMLPRSGDVLKLEYFFPFRHMTF